MTRPRVLIADDHTLILEAFRKLLADACEVVGTVSDGHQLMAAAVKLKPDVIVLDISMPVLNGLEAARQLKKTVPDVRLVVVTMNEDPDLAAEAFRAGASGYLIKRSAVSELLTAIREAMERRSYVTPLIAGELMSTVLNHGGGSDRARQLTGRQREVVQLIAEGRSMKEIAAILNITPRTVAFHKYRVMDQLNITTTAELVRFAIAHHIV
jgi:DNA-binding NarL/FixJ family response regulator